MKFKTKLIVNLNQKKKQSTIIYQCEKYISLNGIELLNKQFIMRIFFLTGVAYIIAGV